MQQVLCSLVKRVLILSLYHGTGEEFSTHFMSICQLEKLQMLDHVFISHSLFVSGTSFEDSYRKFWFLACSFPTTEKLKY